MKTIRSLVPTRSAKTFRVIWEIDVEAVNEVEAAKHALAVMRDHESVATSFTVTGYADTPTTPSARTVFAKEVDLRFRNFYECPCGCAWDDLWDCACNDKCPICNKEIEPNRSEETV